MASDRVRAILNRGRRLKDRKRPWADQFQLIGEYIMTRKQNFTEVNEPGAFLTRDLFDATAIKANDTMSSALIGSLWPNGAKTFQLLPAEGIEDSKSIKDYFNFVTREMASIMDDSRAGLTIALNEYMRDQGSFGTSGVGVFENEKGPLPIRYVAWDVKTMSIDENSHRFVDVIYNEEEMTIRKLITEYGVDNVSKKSRDLFNNGKQEDMVQVLHAIEPRLDGDPLKFGNKDMPIASIHIEIKAAKILRESGFEEMPVFVSRFAKALGEIYGRSPGMAALPDIIELNAIWEAVTIATEKQLDPPLLVTSDGDLGPSIIDTSAGAINVVNVSGRPGAQKPIEPLFIVGEMQSSVALIEKLVEAITGHFFIDRLLDLNNDTRMTFGEAQIRNELRGASLGSIFARQEAELFTPMIGRTFNILLKRGRLGVIAGSREQIALMEKGITPLVIPASISDRMIKGEEVFKIKYVSPAKRTMQAEEVQGLLATQNYAILWSSIVPEAVDNIDIDFSIKRISELTGASEEAVRDLQSIEALRKARAAQAAAQAQLDAAAQASEIARNAGQAQASVAQGGASKE